ncbi:MAG: 6-carboxytetrahydropterin synthase [Candidatus Neomarinimicrobiota bacterium]
MPSITKSFKFSAAHQYGNPSWSEEKNREMFGDDVRLHGHDYILEVTVKGDVDPATGFVVNLRELMDVVNKRVITLLDHSTIEKDVHWFREKQPSAENLVVWIWNQIGPELKGVALHRLRLRETDTIYAEYFGPDK